MIFQHWSLTYCIPLVKDQSSFYEIRRLMAFSRVNRKQFNVLKTLLEYLENYAAAYWRWFGHRSFLTNYVLRTSSSYTGCFERQNIVLSLRKTHFIKGYELSTKCTQLVGMLWRGTFDDESEAIKFRRPRRQTWSPRWEPNFTIHILSNISRNKEKQWNVPI